MKIAYLGDENSHTYAAAKSVFFQEDDLFVPCKAIDVCFDALCGGSADYAVVPLENSVEGTVRETLQKLANVPVYIVKEVNMPIEQSLICYRGANKSDITTIYSHYQALSQCKNYLAKNFPGAESVSTLSTSEALKKVTSVCEAAIARKSGGPYTQVLESKIQDLSTNETRFIVLSTRPGGEGGKCSIIFDTANKAGALLEVLECLKDAGANMTKLESRPKGDKLGRYIFFSDFIFSGTNDELMKLLERISRKTNFLKYLGKYTNV